MEDNSILQDKISWITQVVDKRDSLANLLLSLKTIIQEGTKNHPILTIRGVGLTHQISTSSKPSQTLDYLVNKTTNYMVIITKAITLSQIHSHSI